MSRKHLAEKADRITRELENDAVKQLSLLLTRPLDYINVVINADQERLNDGLEFDRRVRAVTSPAEHAVLQQYGEELASTPGEDGIQMSKWARTRIIYIIDPDAADAIHNTDWGTTVIPGEVLRRLPHRNPFVLLPRPFRVPTADGNIEKYEGFIVLGMRPPRKRSDSDDPDNNGLVLHFIGRLVDPVTDQPLVAHLPQMTTGATIRAHHIVGMRVLTTLDDQTMEERQKYAAEDVRALGAASQVGFVNEAHALAVTEEMTTLALSLLVYLVTDDADTEHVRLPAGKKTLRKATGATQSASAATVVEVGYRVGAALRGAQRAPREPSSGTGKRTVTPHLRKAHFHTFRRGKGHSERFIKWLPPIPVNITPGQAATKTQVHFR